MQYVCLREEMQAVDAASIRHFGIPGIVLMEKAAMAAEEEILLRFPRPAKTLILSEAGNNGGDGLALCRLLMARGFLVTVYEIGGVKKPTESYSIQKKILQQLGACLVDHLPEEDYEIYVDAIFGVGLKREVTGIHRQVIEKANDRTGFKIALDLPSGIDASSGQVLGCGFQADLTVTFGLMKAGLLLYPGASFAGEVVCREIGFPQAAIREVSPGIIHYDKGDLSLLPVRHPRSHKGTYGRVLLIAGSKNMAGAAYLSGLAAYRSGCGLVQIFTCEENREILQSLLPEAIMTTYEDSRDALARLRQAMDWATVIGLGPGLGRGETGRQLLFEVLSTSSLPLVIDADGLNLLADLLHDPTEEGARLYEDYKGTMILTPHLMEMQRLTGTDLSFIRDQLLETAAKQADSRHIYVLKDARTIVSDGSSPAYINVSGNHGMAVAGSGDVLTGILCGFLAGGLSPLTAARLGVYCHGLAGDAAAAAKGYYGLMASDLTDYLPQVTRGINE